MPLLNGIASEVGDDDLLRLLTGLSGTDQNLYEFKWDLSETNVIVWGVSNDEGIAWPDRDLVVQQLERAYDAIEQYINVDFQFGGVFDNPILAAEAEVDLVAYPTAYDPADPYGATANLPLTKSPDFPNYVGVEGDFKVMLRPDGSTSDFALGSEGFTLLLHEIGHTLGLKHPHDGGATIANVDLPKGFDNDWASFMSYKDEFASENTAWDPVTPMVLDVLALQYLYGPNIVHNAGDTEFTVRRYDDYYTYWDPSGNDVVNASEALEGWNIYLPYLQISTQQSTLAGLAVPVSQDTDSFDTFAPTDLVWLMGEIENAIGSNFDDGLVGNALDNFLSSGDGDDFLRGSSGNDQLDGGAGQDTADYSGNQTSYTVQFSASGTTITDRRPSQDGTDTLVDVENLQFLDGAFDIGIRSGATGLSAEDFAAIAELYIAYFDRAPASKGLLYWGTRLDDGMALPEIANSFFVQPETQRTYEAFLNEDGSLNNTEAFVSAVFNNVLGRDPTGPYWVNELNTNPDITPAIFILAVLNGAKAESGGAADRDYLASKTDIGVYFSAIKGLSEYDDTVSVMNIFDGSTASVNAAVSAIDQIHADALDPINGEFLMPLVGVIDDPFAIA